MIYLHMYAFVDGPSVCIRRSLIICTLYQMLFRVFKSKNDDMGEMCSMYRRDKKCVQNFS
jgi:hypothetical protein